MDSVETSLLLLENLRSFVFSLELASALIFSFDCVLEFCWAFFFR
jgi:hypothetical protein